MQQYQVSGKKGLYNSIFKPSNTDFSNPPQYQSVTIICTSYKMYKTLDMIRRTWCSGK